MWISQPRHRQSVLRKCTVGGQEVAAEVQKEGGGNLESNISQRLNVWLCSLLTGWPQSSRCSSQNLSSAVDVKTRIRRIGELA